MGLLSFDKARQRDTVISEWLKNYKSSFVYDIYKEKKETFKSLLESIYFSRGPELHRRLKSKYEQGLAEAPTDINHKVITDEAGKMLDELRDHYWMCELKYEHMQAALVKMERQLKRAEVIEISQMEKKIQEKKKLDQFLGSKNSNSRHLLQSASFSPKQSFSNIESLANKKPSNEQEIFEQYNIDFDELKKYKKQLKSKLLSRYLHAFSNLLKAQYRHSNLDNREYL